MRIFFATVLCCFLCVTADAQKSATRPHLSVSGKMRVQLKLAYLSITDMRPLSEDFALQDTEARRQTRLAEAMAVTHDEKLAAESLETYRIVRGSCRYETTSEAYSKCEEDASAKIRPLIIPIIVPKTGK